MGEYLVDHQRVFNGGDHFDGAAAFTARFDVDGENTLQSLCPEPAPDLIQGLSMPGVRRALGLAACRCLVFLPLPRFAGVTCARYLLVSANTP